MQRFQFRLETLLTYRNIQKEQAEIKLGDAVNKLQLAQEILLGLSNKLVEDINTFRVAQQQHMTIEKLKIFSYYFDKLNNDICVQKQQVQEADQYRQECLIALEEAVKHFKLVEKLREKRLLQYQAKALQEEQKIIDEIAMQIYVRGN